MKLQKILILTFFLTKITLAWYENDVIPNYDSGTYDKVIDLELKSDSEKIFYYTDRIWSMQNLIEYTNPILLKEDSYINVFSIKKDNYDSSFIEEFTYKFQYTDWLEIQNKNWNIVIFNNSWKIQNIWLWKIIWNNISKEITKNTFLKNKESFEVNYKITENENIQLFSPNNNLKYNYKLVFKTEVPEDTEEVSVVEIEKTESTKNLELEDITENKKFEVALNIIKNNINSYPKEIVINNDNINKIRKTVKEKAENSKDISKEKVLTQTKASAFETENNVWILFIMLLVLYLSFEFWTHFYNKLKKSS